ncbi:NUDIX domain-containing protein [Vibrio sp. AK197]
MRVFFSCLLFLLGILSIALPSYADEASITSQPEGALCIVRADEKIVLIHESLTDKMSLPGGTISADETPEVTAQRETWEETGLVVKVKQLLGQTEQAYFYECASESDVIAYELNNILDGHEIPVWFAPHYGVEVSSAMLIEPSSLDSGLYRYPKQWDTVKALFNQAEGQNVTYVGNLIAAAPVINQVELNWILGFQHAIKSLPDGMGWLWDSAVLMLNQLTNPLLFLLIFPLLYWQFGLHFAYRVFYLVAITSLLCFVARQTFALPRPHVYIPAIELSHSDGFSMPSLALALWCSVGILVLNAFERFSLNRYFGAFIFLLIAIMTAKFYSGAAFIVDMLVGSIFGILTAWHIIRLEDKPGFDLEKLICSRTSWALLAAVAAVLALIFQMPSFTVLLATLLTACGIIWTGKESGDFISFREMVFMVLLLVLVNEIISFSATLVSSSSLLSLVAEILRFPLLLLVFNISALRSHKSEPL